MAPYWLRLNTGFMFVVAMIVFAYLLMGGSLCRTFKTTHLSTSILHSHCIWILECLYQHQMCHQWVVLVVHKTKCNPLTLRSYHNLCWCTQLQTMKMLEVRSS
jgi:hypothetical protein